MIDLARRDAPVVCSGRSSDFSRPPRPGRP